MKVSEAQEKLCPFIQREMVAANNVVLKNDMILDRKSPVNINCLTTGCMSWKGYEVGDYGDPSGSCRLLDKD